MEQRQVETELDDAWAYGPGVLHGGWLVERLAREALREADHPHPLAVSTHFLRAPRTGAATIEVTPLRSGRSVSTTRVALLQGGRPCLDAVVTAGLLGEPGEPAYEETAPPALPPLEECVRSRMPEGQPRNGIVEQVDLRHDPASGASGRAEVASWLRFADERPVDPFGLLCLADALPPVTLALGIGGWVPTVELTVHVRALPAEGWLRGVQRARLLQDGWLDEECELFDSTGRLVAQGHQLAAVRA